jgi:hypothetical protein
MADIESDRKRNGLLCVGIRHKPVGLARSKLSGGLGFGLDERAVAAVRSWQDDFFEMDLNQIPMRQIDPSWDSSKAYSS